MSAGLSISAVSAARGPVNGPAPAVFTRSAGSAPRPDSACAPAPDDIGPMTSVGPGEHPGPTSTSAAADQKAASSSSMMSVSRVSMTERVLDSSGRKFLAKNDATPTLPS